jgi:hypothetical protein
MPPVTFQCGRSQSVSGSPQRIARVQSGLCTACWLKQQPVVFVMSAHSVSVTRGYPIRAELQARGYWFRRPNWRKRFATATEQVQEIAWIDGSGFTLEYGKPSQKTVAKRVVWSGARYDNQRFQTGESEIGKNTIPKPSA